jgi:hypothetical protein
MGYWLLVLGLLSLAFPPLALVVLAILIYGIFAKGIGMFADTEQDFDGPGRRIVVNIRPEDQQPDVELPPVIDARSYPVPPESLPGPPKDG